jgi:hypothetical protein
VPPLFKPRLVVPVEYAGRWLGRGSIEVSPSGRLAFIELVTDEDGIDRVLEEMTTASADWLRKNPGAPPIMSVARYEREPKGENDYLMLPVALGLYAEYRPYVDCEDLEIGVSAEARVRQGLPARPEKRRQSERMWHIVSNLGDGRIQDTTGILLQRQGRM